MASTEGRNGASGGKRVERRARTAALLTRDVQSFFTRELWSRELATLPTFRRFAYKVARVTHLTILNFVKDRCSWRASALTLSLIHI